MKQELERGLEQAGKRDAGFETRRQKRMIAAAVFGRKPPPTMLDRYTVIRELGSGGMGTVYLAYDDQLDRRVAVKLLRGRGAPEAQARLQREAQVMARLSHPNVVTVYEVGSFEGEMFVAMEYVKGQDLRGWMDQEPEPRPWPEVLAMFLPAGEGLAAAHEAGIVHRDFKPDNVLVGDDGRVRVADFGLAHGDRGTGDTGDAPDPREPGEPTDPETQPASHRTELHTPLTKTGALMGTPAYMAPEQYLGQTGDARSDQFSFCVALWEALYGHRPFAGRTLAALAAAISSGQLERDAAAAPGVPAWLRALLERGLAQDPDARWPDMRALLAALADDPLARRRRRLRAAAGLSATLVTVLGLAWLAATQLRHNIRQHYWNVLTEQHLEIERTRGLRQAKDDAARARDATKMSVYRNYRTKVGVTEHTDPSVAAVLLREIEAPGRASSDWISAANLTLGRPLSHAIWSGHDDTIFALAFGPDDTLYSAAADGEVRRWTLDGGSSKAIYAHEAAVTSLVVLPDGRALISASEDGSVRLWPTEGGEAQVLTRHEAGVTSLALDPSARVLASTSRDTTARLIELDSRVTTVLEGHGKAVLAASFDDAGARLVTGSSDNEARVWRVADGAPLAVLEGHRRDVFHARFVGDDWVVTGSDDGTVRGWKLGTDVPAPKIEPSFEVDHRVAISALDVAGERVASAAVDGTVRVTSIAAPDQPVSIDGHREGVWALAFTPDGQRLVTASFDGTARVVRADGRGPARVLRGHREPVLRLALSRSGRWLATGSWDTDVRVWDLERPDLELPLIGHRGPLQHVEIDAAGERVLTASSDASARIWDARDGSELAVLRGAHALNVAVFSPDGQLVATGHNDARMTLWNTATQARRDHKHKHGVMDLAFAPAGDRLAAACSDGSVWIWATDTGERLAVLRGHEGLVFQVEFDAGGERLISASADATVRLWDARSGEALAVLRGHQAAVRAFAIGPEGRGLATASDDHDARLWPTPTRAPESALVLRGHTQKLASVAFDRRGARVVTASADGTARVWDADSGAPLRTLRGHSEALWGAAFTDDDHVLTHADDNSLRLWSLREDGPPIVLSGHGNAVTAVALGPEGRWAVSASPDGHARIWSLAMLSRDPEVLAERLWAAALTCLSVDQRVRELGEAQAEAEAAHATCARELAARLRDRD